MKIKINKKGKIQVKAILIIVGVVLVATTFGLLGWWYRGRQLYSDVMIIEKDDDFTEKYNLPGNGTKEDPYKIENLTYNNYTSVKISFTTKYFVIQYCEFKSYIKYDRVVEIQNVRIGTTLIRNNTFTQEEETASDFIDIFNAPGSCIVNNTFGNTNELTTFEVARIERSNYTRIESNTIYNMKWGLAIYSSYNSQISSNVFIANMYGSQQAITMDGSDNLSIGKNSIQNIHRGIYCGWTSEVIIHNNSITDCTFGMDFYRMDYSTISQNSINNSHDVALKLDQLKYSNVNNNTINDGNDKAVYMDHCDHNIITCNSFSNNSAHATQLFDCDMNIIWNNNFVNNNIDGTIIALIMYYGQAFDNDWNYWNHDVLPIGNYWSDLVWNMTATYPIDFGNDSDYHPLEIPVLII